MWASILGAIASLSQLVLAIFDMFKKSPMDRINEAEKEAKDEKQKFEDTGRPKWD